MSRDMDADYYGFNRDEGDGTREVESFWNVERARGRGRLSVGHQFPVGG